MEYFKSSFKSVLGSSQSEEKDSYADTVERLVERIQSSTLLEDRRDACRALKALSRKYRIEVGAQGMNGLYQILQSDSSDTEIISYALETLCNITSPQPLEEEEKPAGDEKRWETVGEQFTEIFIKSPDNVGVVLSFLDEYSFRVRWPAVKLLSNLVTNKPKDIQEIILISPMGVSKLMDLLSDNREVIRNDTLLLLIQLTKGNANIQKIVAFENAFDRLFEVISEEGYADGGIVVEDCLLFMLNLLRNNASNQNFFKEGSYIQRLSPMFELPNNDQNCDNWLPQKVSNIYCMLQVIRSLVAPTNPTQVTASCQKIMYSSDILQALCKILMANGVPVNILTESINAVADIIRGNYSNQEFFSTIQAPCTPPREALVILLMSMVNEKQPITLRCAVLYCFQCFLFKNEFGQSKLIQTLLPSTVEQDTISTGQLLCAGLFSLDSVSNWFASVALSHSLIDNPVQRELMLKVMLTPSLGSTPVSLLSLITDLLQTNPKYQSKIGFLILLSTWLSHCPMAVNTFLEISSSVPYLTTQAGALENDENEELVHGLCAFLMGICLIFSDDSSTVFSRENLYQLIVKRIGIETFLDKLNDVSRHEMYSKASKHPQLYCKTSKELLLDYEFCRLFKILESMIVKAVTRRSDSNGDVINKEPNENIEQYKEMIRIQDRRLSELNDENMKLKEQLTRYVTDIDHLRQQVSELQEQNTELKLKELTLRNELSSTINSNTEKSEFQQVSTLEEKLKMSQSQIMELNEVISQLKRDQEDLLILMVDQEAKIEKYKLKLKELGNVVEDDDKEVQADQALILNGIPDV